MRSRRTFRQYLIHFLLGVDERPNQIAGLHVAVGNESVFRNLKELLEGGKIFVQLSVSDREEHVDAFVYVESRWLDFHGVSMEAAPNVELSKSERLQTVNVKLSYALLNRILGLATPADLVKVWNGLRYLVPGEEEAAGSRNGKIINAVASAMLQFGLHVEEPVELPMFIFPLDGNTIGVAIAGAPLFRTTHPYRDEDVSIRLWAEGRIGLGRGTTSDEIRFLRNHIALEPWTPSEKINGKILERYRKMSSLVLDIFERTDNSWAVILNPEMRAQFVIVHDAIGEMFDTIDKYKLPYRTSLPDGERAVSLRNDPSQYALVANIR